MQLHEDLAWRGLIKDKTFADGSWLDKPQTFYHGVDASADSLTIGNLAALMLARRLMDAGWKAILLVGGATSLIGDPGGKEVERELQPREEIVKNTSSIKSQIKKIFGEQQFKLVDNFDWFSDVKYLDFLREVGKHFSMTELMQRDFVGARMGASGSGISYAEFSYSLIQGYDFLQLHQKHRAVLQIGGSDQWGNMLSGVSLTRKKAGKEVHALSMPLVVDKATGRKFGKTEAGAVWLDRKKTTPTEFYQFWINVDDADVEDYLKIFTLLSKEKIEELTSKHKADPTSRSAQTALAKAVTELVHGQASDAQGVTKYLTSQASIADASPEDIAAIRKEIPMISALAGDPVVGILVNSKLAASNTEARRLLTDGAIYINGQPLKREKVEAADFKNGRFLLRRGKAHKDSVLVEQHS